MGFKYGKSSQAVMDTVHPVLQITGLYLLEDQDHSAIEGFRTKSRQDYYYASGRTRPGNIITNVKWPNGNHNGIDGNLPSLAVHWRPYPWPTDLEDSKQEWKNLKRFYHLIGKIAGVFKMLQIGEVIPDGFNIVSGGDWDDDNDLDDQHFNDLLHTELHGPSELIKESAQWKVEVGDDNWPWTLAKIQT